MGEINDNHEHTDSCCKADREFDDELSGGSGDLVDKSFSLSFEHLKIKLFDKLVSCCSCIPLDDCMICSSK